MSPNLIASQITKSERWTKLYRTIHHLFLKDEFVHIEDYMQMVNEMNARIAMVEAKMTAELAKVAIGLSTHIHLVPQSPAGVNPSAPALPAPFIATPSPSKPVVPVRIAMERTDLMYLGMGPATAPLSGGFSPDQELANITIASDIGV